MEKKELIESTTIIIPVYNEREIIAMTLRELRQECPIVKIIVVDDASTDGSYEEIIKQDINITVIKHSYNKGYGASLKTGLKNCNTKYAIFFDSDGQHDPKDINRLIAEIPRYDMVVGARTKDSELQRHRKPGKWILQKVANLMIEQNIPDINSGLRIVNTGLAKNYLHLLPDKFSFSTTITLVFMKELLDVKFIQIKTRRRAGKSTVKYFYDGFNTLLLIIRIIILFDPLKVFIPTSIFIFMFGVIRFVQMLIQHEPTTVTSLFGMLTGVLIFFFGLLADQLASIRRELK